MDKPSLYKLTKKTRSVISTMVKSTSNEDLSTSGDVNAPDVHECEVNSSERSEASMLLVIGEPIPAGNRDAEPGCTEGGPGDVHEYEVNSGERSEESTLLVIAKPIPGNHDAERGYAEAGPGVGTYGGKIFTTGFRLQRPLIITSIDKSTESAQEGRKTGPGIDRKLFNCKNVAGGKVKQLNAQFTTGEVIEMHCSENHASDECVQVNFNGTDSLPPAFVTALALSNWGMPSTGNSGGSTPSTQA